MSFEDEMKKSDIKYDNLVLEGGGIRGLAFLGAHKYLEDRGVIKNIKRVVGSSAGSIYAFAVACKISNKLARDILTATDFSKFRDDSWGYVIDAIRLVNGYGICKGDYIFEWFRELARQFTGNPDITFIELYHQTGVHLVMTGTNLNLSKTEYFSHEKTPSMKICVALRISTSIPLFFRPIIYNDYIYVDGGMLNNYPIWYFEQGNTVGLKLMNKNEKVINGEIVYTKKEINNIKDFSISLVDSMLNQIEKGYIKKDYWDKTVIINTGDIDSTEFELSKEKTIKLLESGYQACQNSKII